MQDSGMNLNQRVFHNAELRNVINNMAVYFKIPDGHCLNAA